MFTVNDRFKVKTNGFTGWIEGVSYNSIKGDWEFYVRWDNTPLTGPFCYMADDVRDLWDKIDKIADAQINIPLPHGHGLLTVDPDDSNIDSNIYGLYGIMPGETPKFGCEHKWVEVGFIHSKIVCYHCNEEQK